jgi:spermidine synthase
MAEQDLNQSAGVTPSRRFLPLLLVLFAGSGCAALIYEIVWLQLLQLVIGSTAVSLGVLLGTFMGGMCLGSVALARIVSALRHPLRVYALLELGIGIVGIAVLCGMPYVGRLYTANVAPGFPGILLRGLVSGVCLLPPTFLMGATLPAIARWIETTPKGVSWLGFFYAGNIAGAVFGCLLAGFYLLRVHDMATATYVAVSINVAVALINLGLATRAPRLPFVVEPTQGSAVRASGSWTVYATIGLSGLCALGAEVIWTRLLSLLLGGTAYTFSIILAVFLVGLGIGSGVGSLLARGSVRPRIALGCCQMLLTAAIVWTACMLAKSLPYWPVTPSISTSPWFNFQLDLVRCIWGILPATCLWGASFPLALAAVASRGHDPGRLVGGVYAANTVGAIVGAIGFSMVLIPWIGTQQSQRVLVGLSAVAALLMFVPLFWPIRANAMSGGKIKGAAFKVVVTVLASSGLAALLVWSVPGVPWGLVAYGRYWPTWIGRTDILYMGEGMNASVAISKSSNGARNFHVSGKVEASTEPHDMQLQRMLGHLPALLHPKPRSVLVVGCGAGVTAGCFVLHPGVERIVICEIEPLIPRVVAQYFSFENYNVLKDPRVEVVYDDARHYILTTREKFDIITSDPIHPWVKGSATLYTKEYFELVKRHLNPGGLVTQWVPLYETKENVVKSELATFFEVFPNGTVWSNDENGKGYDIVLLGQAGPTKIDVDELQQRLDRKDYLSVRLSLDQVEIKSAVGLLAKYAGRGPDLQLWLKHAEINLDRNLRLQYLAGLGLNSYQNERIYDDMVFYRKFPEDLFDASDQTKQELRKAILRRNSKQ